MSSSITRLTTALTLAALVCFSATAATPPLVTDRPDQTESAQLVPPSNVQFEIGLSFAEEDAGGVESSSYGLPETLVRWGLNEHFELRFGMDGYRWMDTRTVGGTSSNTSGFGDLSIGIKNHLWKEDGARPQAAFLGTLTLPTGESGFSSERADPSFRLLLANSLTESLSLGYNVGAAWETSETAPGVEETRSSLEWTVALGIGVNERVSLFVEGFGSTGLSAGGAPSNSVDGGMTWLIRDNLQFDCFVGFGLSEAADDWSSGIGISYRHPS